MKRLLHKTCPHCQNPFEATRKNQDYCSDDCRIDANNARAKQRYAQSKREGSQLDELRQQVQRLQQQLAARQQQIDTQKNIIETRPVVITVVKESKDILWYEGRPYKRGPLVSKKEVLVTLEKGVGLLMPGNTILCQDNTATNSQYRYLPDP